jgi:hypothetical protein
VPAVFGRKIDPISLMIGGDDDADAVEDGVLADKFSTTLGGAAV